MVLKEKITVKFCFMILSDSYLAYNPGLIVWQSSHQPNWVRQNFSPTKELIPIYLLKEP